MAESFVAHRASVQIKSTRSTADPQLDATELRSTNELEKAQVASNSTNLKEDWSCLCI